MLKKLLVLLIIIGIGTGIAALVFAERIPDETSRETVLAIRSQVLGTTDVASSGLKSTILNQLTSRTSEATGSYGVVVGDKEIYVEDILMDVTKDIQKLPQEQYQVLQQRMCADLIEQAKKEACNME